MKDASRECMQVIEDLGDKMMERPEDRIDRYCCSSMWSAVEKRGFLKDRVCFLMVRGEHPGWRFGKSSLIVFCPWCGRRLPDKPFIEK